MQNVLDTQRLALVGQADGLNVPEVAVLSQSVMQWRVLVICSSAVWDV